MDKKIKNIQRVKQGKKNRASGSAWERKVRLDLESKNWILDRWNNNVKWDEDNINKSPEERTGILVQANAKYNPFTRSLMLSKGGFPDFICFKLSKVLRKEMGFVEDLYEVIGVECKINGYLDPEEREKCQWLLKNKVFSKILIASKKKEGRKVIIEYDEF